MRSGTSLNPRLLSLLVAALLLSGCASSGPAAPPAIIAAPAAVPSVNTPRSETPAAAAAARTAEPAPNGAPAPTAEPGPSAAPTQPPAPTEKPAATPGVAPTPTPTRRANQGDSKPFAMNVFREGDYVAQYTFEWCVGASLQMALNMTTDGSHTTKADQHHLWNMARDRSFSPYGGANPRGWTAVLNDMGVGPYQLVSLPTFEEAIDTAAAAIRATRRPVGLVMWAGRHAWVMSGFTSTADPRRFDDYNVTGIRVLDPLYPHHNVVWGRSPKPNSLISPNTLAKQFVFRDGTHVNLDVPPGFLLVLPVAA